MSKKKLFLVKTEFERTVNNIHMEDTVLQKSEGELLVEAINISVAFEKSRAYFEELKNSYETGNRSVGYYIKSIEQHNLGLISE